MKTNATGNTRHKQNNKQDVGNADEAIQGTESKARVVVMGDLHLSEGLLNDYFHPARADALRALDGASGGERLVVQVGDLGAYDSNPGSQACFEEGSEMSQKEHCLIPHPFVAQLQPA